MKDKKHKRKQKEDELEEVIAKSSKMDSIIDKDVQNGDKKLKKKKKRDGEDFVEKNNGEDASSLENGGKIKKKKKKKRKQNDNEECVDSTEDVSNIVSEDDHKVKKKKKKKHDSEITPIDTKDICETEELQTRKKSKKKKRHKSVSPHSDAEDHSEEEPKPKKKKKHKKNKDEENVNGDQNDTKGEENQPEKLKLKNKKNKKSKKDTDDTNCSNEISNTCISSNHNPQKNGACLGQWSTASFEDNTRTEKFHRLLGGMKKDVPKKPKGKLFGGLVDRSGGNNALDKEGQEQLNKNLQAQYDSALSMRLGSVKGIGFGFTPPPGEGKKFYIDTGKSSSMKFDD